MCTCMLCSLREKFGDLNLVHNNDDGYTSQFSYFRLYFQIRQKHYSESSPTFSPVILSEPKTLPEFIKKYSDSLPRTALVTTGYLDDNSTLEISCYEILRIDSLHTVSVVLATNANKEPLPPIPMTEEMRFSLLYDPNNNTAEAIKGFVFSGVRNLLSTVQLPKVVCAVDDWNGDFVAISRGEILVFNEKCLPRRSNATSGLVTFSVSKMVDKFLPKECTGNFSTDPMLIQMSLQNMIAHITNPFPCKVYTPLQRAVLTLVGSDIIQNVNFSLFDICRGEFVPSMMQLTLNQTVIELALIEDPSSTIESSVALPKKQPVCGNYGNINAGYGDTPPPLPPKNTTTLQPTTAPKTHGCQSQLIAEATKATSVHTPQLPLQSLPHKPMHMAGKRTKSLPQASADNDANVYEDVLCMHETGTKATSRESLVQEDSRSCVCSTDASGRSTSEQCNPLVQTEKTSVKGKEPKKLQKSKAVSAGACPKRWHSFCAIEKKGAGNAPIPGYHTASKPLSLKLFISLYFSRLPVSIHICTNASLVPGSEYLDVIALENKQVVLAEDSARKQVDIPLVSTENFSLLYYPAESEGFQDPVQGSTFNSVSDLLKLKNAPKVIRVTRSWSDEVAENEILIVRSTLLREDAQKGFLAFSVSSQSEKFISKSCQAYYSTAAALLGMPMLELIQHVPAFLPCRVCRVRWSGETPKCYPNDIITLKEVFTAPVLRCVPIGQRRSSTSPSVHIPISACGVEVVVLTEVQEESTSATKSTVRHLFLSIPCNA